MSRSKAMRPAGSAANLASGPPNAAATGFLRRLRVEHGLIASGMASAVASCGFAAFMMVHNTGLPIVPNGEYFSVFAKMERHLRSRDAEIAARTGKIKGDIDPIVTGSIAPRATVDPTTVPLPGFWLREAFDGTAIIDSPSGVQIVHAGSILVGAGRVTAVERRGGRMVVATERGIVQRDAD